LSPEWLIHDGVVVPSVIVLSHAEQLDRLRQTCPEAAERAVVLGDPVFDRMTASSALRPSYRRAYGIGQGQRLVVVSSTWGDESLFGQHPRLPLELAERLPSDEFRVIFIPHPNITAKHSKYAVSHWLAAARRAGVRIPDDVDEWRAAIVAADLVVGDHGSVPYYAACLGIPVLLATAPVEAVAPNSPIAALLAAAPRLDPAGDYEKQVRAVRPTPADQASSVPGGAAAALRATLYRTMALAEPGWAAEIDLLPLPAVGIQDAPSHLVWVHLMGPRAATVIRLPGERLRDDPHLPRGAHLVVSTVEPRRPWLTLADVLVGPPGPEADEWIAKSLAALPGALLAAAPGPSGWTVGDRSGPFITASGAAAELFVSVAYDQVSRGVRLDELTGDWTITTGEVVRSVTVSAR